MTDFMVLIFYFTGVVIFYTTLLTLAGSRDGFMGVPTNGIFPDFIQYAFYALLWPAIVSITVILILAFFMFWPFYKLGMALHRWRTGKEWS